MNHASALSTKVVVSLEESLERGPVLDNTAVFEKLSGIMRELRAKLVSNFELHPGPNNAKYGSYSAPTGLCRGSLNTFSGPEIELLVDSWMGNPETGFTNLHFNTWLGPKTRVPHLAIVLGTIPELFFYFDFVPRTDLTTDLEYLDKYYEGANARAIAFHDDPRMKPFVSKSVYMRQSISPTGLCFSAARDEETIEYLRRTAHGMMDQWITWVREAEVVPAAERPALAARDRFVRRAVAERDPANSLAEKLLGKTEMETLVGLLWGVEGFGSTGPSLAADHSRS